MSSLLGHNARKIAHLLGKDVGFCREVDFPHILRMDYKYRLESPVITYAILESGEGFMSLEVTSWRGQPIEGGLVRLRGVKVTLPCTVTVDLICGRVKIADSDVPATFQPLYGRRFIATLRIIKKNGFEKTRTVMHYISPSDRRIDAGYFDGDDYVSYEDFAPSQARHVADWIKNHATPGRLLEIGCAYGYLLECMQALGWDVYGGDICLAAVKKAGDRIGNGRVKVWNAEREPCPFEGPFDADVGRESSR